MKNWTNSIALALTAATLTLTATACTEDGPGAFAEPEAPEAFDPETIYEALLYGKPPENPLFVRFLQFDSEEAKRATEDFLGVTDHPDIARLVPLSAERAAQVRDNEPVVLMGSTADGGWQRIHTYNALTPQERSEYRRRTCCSQRREQVRR